MNSANLGPSQSSGTGRPAHATFCCICNKRLHVPAWVRRLCITTALLGILFGLNLAVTAQTPIPLWPDGAPGTRGKEEADIPALTTFLPDSKRANGAAMLVI